MNSITYGIGYFLTILVVNVFCTDYTLLSERFVPDKSPFNFGYQINNNFLIMEITLKNIPPSVTAVYLKYIEYSWSQPGKVKGNIDTKTSEVKFMILKQLISNLIVVNVELHSQQGICDETNIAEGRDAATLNPYGDGYTYTYQDEHTLTYYYMTGYCLIPKPCEIIVDLTHKCPDEQASPYFSCYIQESQYVCTFTKQNILKRRFYQTYDNSSFIGPSLEIEVTRTKLLIKLELFDNNTSVNVASQASSYNTRNKNIIWTDKLSLSAKDIYDDDNIVTELRYSEIKDVEYSCQEYVNKTDKYLHVGFINAIDNKIKTISLTSIKRKFKMADNGTILCCLYYTKTMNEQEVHMRRFVENKILLIFQSQESISTLRTESEKQTTTSLMYGLIWYLVPSFLGLCVLMLTLYIVKQKLCKKLRPADETVELDNQATQNQVLYANLDLVRGENQPQGHSEEPHYANIVGVLHPFSK